MWKVRFLPSALRFGLSEKSLEEWFDFADPFELRSAEGMYQLFAKVQNGIILHSAHRKDAHDK